jgi:hypothetical protein
MAALGFYRNLSTYRYDHDSPFDSPWARSAGCQERALQFNRQRLFDQFSPAHRHGPHKYVVGGRQQPQAHAQAGNHWLTLPYSCASAPHHSGAVCRTCASASQSTPELGQSPQMAPGAAMELLVLAERLGLSEKPVG